MTRTVAIRVRTDAGEEDLELDEFEARIRRGDIVPFTPVRWDLAGGDWMEARQLDVFRRLYSPRRLSFTRAFNLGRFPPITFGLVGLCGLLYVLTLRRGPLELDNLVAVGAKAPPLLRDLGQTWRLLTANFLHSSPLHLFFNLVVLFNAGGALENAYRKLDYLLLVVAAAVGTTMFSFLFSDVVSNGASGIAYGMLGGIAVFGLKYKEILPPRYRGILGGGIIPVVVACLYVGWTSRETDNWGHLGGLFAGIACALLFRPRLLADPPPLGRLFATRVAPLAALLILPIGAGPALRRAGLIPRLDSDVLDRFGLELAYPEGWRRGVDRHGQVVFHNGLPGSERASVSAISREVPAHVVDLGSEATDFIARELVSERESGQVLSLRVGTPFPRGALGLPGVGIEASFATRDGEFRLTAVILARGKLVYTLVGLSPLDREDDYRPLFEKVVAASRAVEPSWLREARGRVLHDPFKPSAWAFLAEAQSRVGEDDERARSMARWAELGAEIPPGR
jgi:membrane associated rhomboid family serine protease